LRKDAKRLAQHIILRKCNCDWSEREVWVRQAVKETVEMLKSGGAGDGGVRVGLVK
jgi:hypothetical protein